MQLSRCEQEVVINFNVTEQTASVYCADPKYIRLMDRLVAEYPEVYKVTAVTDVSKTYAGDYNIVMSHISHIREKIEDDPGHPMYIQTVWGVGYKFNEK